MVKCDKEKKENKLNGKRRKKLPVQPIHRTISEDTVEPVDTSCAMNKGLDSGAWTSTTFKVTYVASQRMFWSCSFRIKTYPP